jgi:hypothetical protein
MLSFFDIGYPPQSAMSNIFNIVTACLPETIAAR